jgi:hypothetical protein
MDTPERCSARSSHWRIITIKPNVPLAWLFFVALVPGATQRAAGADGSQGHPPRSHADAAPPPIFQKLSAPECGT